MAKDKDKKKVKGFKEFDSTKFINTEPTIDEALKGTAVFAWGRMNPMTAGHEKLVKKVASVAKAEKGIPHVFLTQTVDKKKNPLGYEDKINFAQKAFGPVVKKSKAKTIFQLMKQLEKSFNRVVMVAGSDRVKEFDKLLNDYNGKEYKFDEIKVVSAGSRDPDADDVSGISGTKMRGYASTDMKKFTANLPKKLKADADKIATLVSMGMNMSEEKELDEALTRQQRRQRSIQMKKYKHKMKRGREKAKRKTATLDVLKKRAHKAALMLLKQKFAKNRRYAEMSPSEKEQIDKRVEKISKKRIEAISRKLLPKVKQAERDRKASMSRSRNEEFDLNSHFETFMEDYYKGVPKDKKDDREAHFKRKAEKPGDGADKDSNYKPAPGDFKDGKRVKTNVSKHTKKYKAMFGEDTNLWGQRQGKKRPHMLMDKNGKVKFDNRFKMYKPKNPVTEDLDYLNEDVNWLMESVEDYALELNEDPTASLKKKADKTGMPMGVLRQVYNRGVAAWKSGHRPGTTPEQWGHARVNSFVTKSSGTWGKADKDLAAKVRKEEVEIDELSMSVKDLTKSGLKNANAPKKKVKDDLAAMRARLKKLNKKENAGEEGTDKLTKKYKKDTPDA